MAEQTPVVLLGAGGYAQVVFQMLLRDSRVKVLGCTDKAMGLSERAVDDEDEDTLKILGDDDILPDLVEANPGLHAVLALGPDLMDVRAKLITVLHRLNIPGWTAGEAGSHVSKLAKIGAGTVVRAGGIVSSCSEIGEHGIVSPGASIDHHATLEKNVYVGQGAQIAPYVHVSDNVVIEMGANINSRVKIGQGARITGGAFVNTDVPDLAVVVGVPGRIVRYLNE